MLVEQTEILKRITESCEMGFFWPSLRMAVFGFVAYDAKWLMLFIAFFLSYPPPQFVYGKFMLNPH